MQQDNNGTGRTLGISLQDLSRLLNGRGGFRINTRPVTSLHNDGDDEDDPDYEDDDDGEPDYYRSLRQAPKQWFPPVTEPSEAGVQLLNSGEYGRIANKIRKNRKERNLARSLTQRLYKPRPTLFKEEVANVCL